MGARNSRRQRVGMIASKHCRQDMTNKAWCSLESFLNIHRQFLLDDVDLVATAGTAEFIRSAEGRMALRGNPIGFRLTPLGASTRGVVSLTAMVKQGEIDRVCFFQDPEDLAMDHPENRLLMRACDEHSARLCFNKTADLWASAAKGEMPSFPDRDGQPEGVALIAHLGRKLEIADFVVRFQEKLRRFPDVQATAGTKQFLDERLSVFSPTGNTFGPSAWIRAVGATQNEPKGPRGGCVLVADQVFKGRIKHVVAFFDHWPPRDVDPDVQILLRAAVDPTLQVNLMLNRSVADEWMGYYG